MTNAYPEPEHRTLVKYNLTRDQWWDLFGDGRCPVCGRKYKHTDMNRRAVVDHDHRTYKIRGMLCGGCNYELGCLHENIAWLENAGKYLRNPTSERLLAAGLWQEVPVTSDAPPSHGD